MKAWGGALRIACALALADERCTRDFTPQERKRDADLLGDDDGER